MLKYLFAFTLVVCASEVAVHGECDVCTICGYVYCANIGDPDGGIPPGTLFIDLPDDWVCPVCGAPKGDFESDPFCGCSFQFPCTRPIWISLIIDYCGGCPNCEGRYTEFYQFGECTGGCTAGQGGTCGADNSASNLPRYTIYNCKPKLDTENNCISCESDWASIVLEENPATGPKPCVCSYPV
jgi:rubredoxin